ncbi:MAG: hypothetical protein KAS12_01410 [Candidatus Aenigmarchaeota archaeon]|nr:hypothetical protein [Candidatus Aenigmarchaeota archaeon]
MSRKLFRQNFNSERKTWDDIIIAAQANEKNKENIEIELRMNSIDANGFLDIYNAYKSQFIEEKSLNAITPYGKKNAIRKIIFTEPKKEEYMTKTVNTKVPFTFVGYNFNASMALEEKIPASHASTAANTLYRFKYRLSVQISDFWRLDLTKVIETRNAELLRQLKDEFFNKEFDNIKDYKLELEIEYTQPTRQITTDDFKIIDKIITIIDPEHLKKLIYQNSMGVIMQYTIPNPVARKRIANFPIKTLKHVTTQVIGLNKNKYSQFYPPEGYYLTDKADGIHGVVIAGSGKVKILTDTVLEIDANVRVPFIVDCEVIFGNSTENKWDDFKLYIFDVMMFDNENIANLGFSERAKYIMKCSSMLQEQKINAITKTFIVLSSNGLQTQITAMYKKKRDYEIDGLILNSPNDNYNQTKIYKWKPYEKNTIDFLAKACPKRVLGIKPYEQRQGMKLYFLFTTITYDLFQKMNISYCSGYKDIFPNQNTHKRFPIQFSPSDSPLAYLYWRPIDGQEIDGTIVEMTRDVENTMWILTRHREDRTLDYQSGTYFGNAFQTAEDNWQNFINPFPLEELYNVSASYFKNIKENIYRPPMGFNSFVKAKMTSLAENAEYLVELGSGRGGDLSKYLLHNIQTLICVDSDKNALSELIQRKYNIMYSEKSKMSKTSVLTVHADVNNGKDMVAKIFSVVNLVDPFADHIISQFAIHYFVEKLPNLISSIEALLKKGGLFMFSCFDGQKVFDLLAKNGGKWIAKENGVVKYQISSKYKSKTLTSGIQKIELMLPFSSNELYEEPLVNIKYVVEVFKKKGFILEQHRNFGELISDYHTINSMMAEKLTTHDIEFISLYDYVILRKK